jgi:hydroxyacylglutathione hydrolase
MIIEQLEVGPIMANCYILGCEETGKAAVVDPGDDADRILRLLADRKLTVAAIVNTHGHFDHVGGNQRLKAATDAPLMIHAGDAPMLKRLAADASMFGLSAENSPAPDRTVDEGDSVEFGKLSLTVLHTPGHSPGGIALRGDGCVFVGDTLFAGSIGRTDLPGGNYETLIRSVREKLFVLPDDTRVFCGHGPETTVGREKKHNPFFR